MNDEPRSWRARMVAFVAYMRDHGHRLTWMHFGQKATPVGVIGPRSRYANDNRRSAAAPTR